MSHVAQTQPNFITWLIGRQPTVRYAAEVATSDSGIGKLNYKITVPSSIRTLHMTPLEAEYVAM